MEFFLISMILALSGTTRAQDYCVGSSTCPIGLESSASFADNLCAIFVDLYYSLFSACNRDYGGLFTITDLGKSVAAKDIFSNGSTPVCDTFKNETVVQDCFYSRGTAEMSACVSLFYGLYLIKNNCKPYFTFNKDAFDKNPVAQAAAEYAKVPCDNCRVNPYMYECQNVGDSDRDQCQACAPTCP